MKITGKTKIYGIIGNPIEHSLSPLFQTWFLEQSGLDAAYIPFSVQDEDVEAAMHGLWALGVRGFNVTVPHKERVLPFVEADESVRLIGAVNTVIRTEQGWKGTNTDWVGFSAALEAVGAKMESATVLLFGAGGTAKAVVYALAKHNIATLYICNRSSDRAETLAAYTRENYSHIRCELIEWSDSNVEAASLKSNIVINTTSIGLKDGEAFPFSFSGDGVAVDVVYRPDGDTAFCRKANEGGRKSIDGLPMLIAQGAAAFSNWQASMPDRLGALRWMEEELGRVPCDLRGWEEVA
ncbi:MAG TPA: shikimate dehydrogenase [Mariprofundaceae bacterium]|nr:shikimate dehydrogenase [Mariprofundaceae bacterium]